MKRRSTVPEAEGNLPAGLPAYYVEKLRELSPSLAEPEEGLGRLFWNGVLHQWHVDRREVEPGCARCKQEAEEEARRDANPPSFDWSEVEGQAEARAYWSRLGEKQARVRLGLDPSDGSVL
jgi:hypothetical protein